MHLLPINNNFISFLFTLAGFGMYVGSVYPFKDQQLKLKGMLREAFLRCGVDVCNHDISQAQLIMCLNVTTFSGPQINSNLLVQFFEAFETSKLEFFAIEEDPDFEKKMISAWKHCIGRKKLIKKTKNCTATAVIKTVTGQGGVVTPEYLQYLCYYDWILQILTNVIQLASHYCDALKKLEASKNVSNKTAVQAAENKVENSKKQLYEYLDEYSDAVGDPLRMDINDLISVAIKRNLISEKYILIKVFGEVMNRIRWIRDKTDILEMLIQNSRLPCNFLILFYQYTKYVFFTYGASSQLQILLSLFLIEHNYILDTSLKLPVGF
ncbi:hypothetical protein RF11_02136 [Thelohanellus kitauei]|uniref:Uncharacterized protein n=1 Tax=Thelohanellus kitauei TaxID=669202 RepID=A0A0C2M0V5_THEKT|nr:hypothetical protein RF11_02136 [Thelohanellus kitauei]